MICIPVMIITVLLIPEANPFGGGLEQELGKKSYAGFTSLSGEYRFQIATSEDLLQVIRQEAHRDMQDYFADWFEHDNSL